jgi:ABC-2 type transport system ATP-binding protein
MIEVYDLSKHYGPVVAVDGLTFEVHPGAVTGFLGPNGSGKSTTMRIILGLDAPDGGEALVCGQPYRRLVRPLHVVGALLDAQAVHGGRTAFRHVEAIARSNGIGRARVSEVLGLAGLDSVAGRRVRGFSLGMKQRLGIAVAMLGDPPVLMFDEPVNGLDPEGIVWIRQLMRSLAAEGRTVLVSSHLMSEMALTADQVIVIGRGQLVADDPVADLTRAGSGENVLVRSPRADQLADLLRQGGAHVEREPGDALAVTGMEAAAIAGLAASAGIAVHELTPRHASLEQAYMELTSDSVTYRAGSPARAGRPAATGKDA